MRFFSPDSLHINTKNFTSIFDFIKTDKHEIIQHDKKNHLISKFGDYNDIPDEIIKFYEIYQQYDKEMLRIAEVNQINLYDTCRLELLSLIVTKDEFSTLGKSWSRDELFEFAYQNFKNDLILNISVAAFWINYWIDYLSTAPKFDIALIFSGCLTYTKSLISILATTITRVFLLETFFTGNEFYCEERFSSLPNSSLLKFKSFYENIKIDNTLIHKDIIKAHNKIISMNNLNVRQPAKTNDIPFPRSKKVLIIGQVVNDFSMLNHGEAGVYSIKIYIELISKILDNTSFNIIFKAHPWENKKNNLKTPFTLNKLKDSFQDKRIAFVEDFNINDLIEKSDHVILLNSQSGIEAAISGIKPIVLAEPFYGKKGFTHDYSIYNIDDMIYDIKNNNIHKYLTLEDYDHLQLFLVKSLQYHLICKFKSGIQSLRYIFSPFDTVQLLNNQAIKKTPFIVPQKDNITIDQSKENQIQPVISKERQLDAVKNNKKTNRYIKKLLNNPRRFFADSKYKTLRPLSKLFKR